jgi:predicted transposase/invertase (TIGR01784 family)
MEPNSEKNRQPVPVERFNLLNDYLFLKIMGEKGDEEQLLSFLNAVLARAGDQALVSIEIIEARPLIADIIENKSSGLDVRAWTADETPVNIEVQLRNLENMNSRSLFHGTWESSKPVEPGQDCHALPNVIGINIVNFEFLPSQGFHTCFHLWEDTERDLLLTNTLEIHFVDMVKFQRLGKKDIRKNPLHRWLTYFDPNSPEDLVEEVIKMDAAIRKAQDRFAFVSDDKEALREYLMREMALSDWTRGDNYARWEGKTEGEKEIARRMKARGRPLEEIVEDTGLDMETIRGL